MNKRDQQIADIASNVEDLREDRLIACRAQILSSYVGATVIERLTRINEITDREPSDFRVFSNSEARSAQHFNDDSYHWDYYCNQLGRSVAIAEERYLFEELAKHAGRGEPIDASEPTLDGVWNGVLELREAGFNPTVLIAPISLYGPVFKQLKVSLDTGRDIELPDRTRLELFWSSKAAPIDRFVILDRRAGEWTVKLDPNTHERLTIAIGRPKAPPMAVQFLVETVVRYAVVENQGLYVIEVSGEPPEEFGLEQQTALGE